MILFAPRTPDYWWGMIRIRTSIYGICKQPGSVLHPNRVDIGVLGHDGTPGTANRAKPFLLPCQCYQSSG
jgi:hypothetical protein